MRTLNLGILAHVDAGKTTLTERLLFAAGVIHKLGSVDEGTTQTDTLDLERQRGITIKAAVASFAIDDLTVNILDTPGHPDFIAEVERVLRVLDGAILVISAVEGVQPQTPLLYRALARLAVPTVLFLNKLDRRGADPERTLDQIAKRLTPAIVPVRTAAEPGTPDVTIVEPAETDETYRGLLVERLAERDESLLTAYVETGSVPWPRLRRALADQSRRGVIHPVFMGSAATGVGVEELLAAIPDLLPAATGDPEADVRGRVFKIERGPGGDHVAYARIFDGTVHARDRLAFGAGAEARVTHLAVTTAGGATQQQEVSVGQIAKLGGLGGIRVGDPIG
ncbi:MAG TPA: GTP-binding protein, partial [Candidatus Limnocylindrales bacterium]